MVKKDYSQENDKVNIAVIGIKIQNIEKTVTEMNEKLDAHYVTKDQFEPVRNLVYGMVGLLLTGIILAIIRLVIIK